MRVFDTHEEAKLFQNAHGGIIHERIGLARRCAYCVAAPFCIQCEELLQRGMVYA